jgi:hypothetical protein
MTTPQETITVKGRDYMLKDLIAVSKFTDRGNIIGFRVANGEDNADDYGVSPGEDGYAALDALRVKYYELEGANEKQQLLYNIGVRGWECKDLIEPFRGWAQMAQLKDEEVTNVIFELEQAL